MVRALLRVAMQVAADRAERADLLVRFLRAIVELEPRGPHPCWRMLLNDENRAELGPHSCWEIFPRHALRWLAAVLPGTPEEQHAEAVALVVAGARRVIVAVDAPPRGAADLRPALRALRKRLPGAELALLCPDSWLAARDALPEVSALLPYAPHDNQADAELERVRAWRPDLVFDFASQRGHRLDRLATGSGALLGFARKRRRVGAGPRRWFGLRERYDPNSRWAFLAPRKASVEDLLQSVERPR
jgi:hypothetical protein